MKIFFDKLSHTNRPFSVTHGGVSLEGSLVKKGYHRVKLDGDLKGVISLACDRCGEEFIEDISSSLSLTLSDEVVHTEDDLDIIEFLDGTIDIEFIIQSEIASIQNSYHICKACEGDDSEFEREF